MHGLGQLRADSILTAEMFSKFLLEIGQSSRVFLDATTVDEVIGYIAPEYRLYLGTNNKKQHVALTNTPRGDMWALGILFYQLVTFIDMSTVNFIFGANFSTYKQSVEQEMNRVVCCEYYIYAL